MKKKLYNMLIKFFFIFTIIKLINTKSILRAYSITKNKCDNELHKYTFNINATLKGNISSHLIMESFTIKSNDNDLDIRCIFPEELIPVENKDILIKCNINNIIYNQFISMHFEGRNDYLDLIDFHEKILYINNSNCLNIKLRSTESSESFESFGTESEEEQEEGTTDFNTDFNTDEICNKKTNCIKCNNSGFCEECKSGYYLDDYNNCRQCLSTCKNCQSLNNCSDCNDEYYNSDNRCVSCFGMKEGCEKCSDGVCHRCYQNSIFIYEEDKKICVNINGQNNNTVIKTKLKFGRIDSFTQIKNNLFFRIHFILLDKYLSRAKFNIIAKIDYKRRNLLREISNSDHTFECEQYGDALGYTTGNKGEYLANFFCYTKIENNDILSITPLEITENDNFDLIQIDDLINKNFIKDKINETPLEKEYKEKNINRITIKKVTDAKLKNELTFKIEFDIDSPTSDERNYIIKLNNEDGVQIEATCTIPILNVLEDKTIDCNAPKDNINEKLTFVQDIYAPKESNNNDLLIVNDNGVTIEVTKYKGLSILAIVGITIAGIFLVGPFIFYLIKYFLNRKENYNNTNINDEDRFEVRRGNIGDNSKEVIFG